MTWGADLTAPARRFLDRRVWVDLDRLYGPPPANPPPRGEGLVLSGKVPGMLKSWIRALDGPGSASSTSASATAKARSSSTPTTYPSPPTS
jgi:hypothetical protein